jgi:polyketide cyclase/dehydrase/lipid transport protein
MVADLLPLHHRSEVLLAVDAARLFAHLDDHRRLASHMEKPSLMTAGASMRIDTDERCGQAVGSVIRMTGRVLGLHLSVEETVTRRDPPNEKVWETIGEPRLLVIGAYRMGFTIAPVGTGTRLVVFIDYRLPAQGIGQALGWLLGRPYAAWCTRRMTSDARAAFGTSETR